MGKLKGMHILVAAALATGATVTMTAAYAEEGQNEASNTLPDAVRSAAIETQYGDHGEIAGAQIGNTDTYVVYVKSPNGCGSGGCPAQIWQMTGDQVAQKESISVGYLPIVILPESDNDMPRLGVKTFDKIVGEAIVPNVFDGENYSLSMWDDLKPADAGIAIVTQDMLQDF